ncbi:hypothetical protein BESB_039360 [Besnoitia besnoiti]|uniref:LamG-like jellyroll fold domain-containing protein n=1 Tax=Besnoitia besnoiti TaxID=94643 RepID=A0A2A9MG35_BESBE|nr:hypothetical protein BESB_039360 [Besnoitia besnoiti]PFH37478.1 hypothetical protein BESB_039360 [Besnoitia besnoiti]
MTYSKRLVPLFSLGLATSFGTMISAQSDIAGLPGDIAEEARDVALRAETILNFADRIYDKCFTVPNAVCLGGTSQIITAPFIPDGLSAWFTFDQVYPVDQSGNGNHMHRAPRAGPPHNGSGASAAFVNGASGTIKSSSTLETSDFTVAFWMYLLGDSNGYFRNVISKGNDASQTPTIMLYPNTRKLSVRVTTTDSSSEGLPSSGSLPLRRWTHITVTANGVRLKLFLNGVEDNEVVLRGKVIPNAGNIVVGSTMENSGFDGYIDDLRIYTRALPCGPGLLANGLDIWHSEMSSGDIAAGEKRLALCCRISSSVSPLVAAVA